MRQIAVIREDVVSIGFEVQNNPFAELTAGINEIKASLGILNDTQQGLRDVGREANRASSEVGSLTDTIHAPPDGGLADPLREAGDEAQRATREAGDLTDELRQTGEQDPSGGVKKLTDMLRHPVKGFKDLIGKAKELAKTKLEGVVAGLPPGLRVAVTLAGKLLGKLGAIGKIVLDKVVNGLKSMAKYAAEVVKSLPGKALSGLKSLAKGAAVGITAASMATAGLGAASVAVGANFEASMSQVAATMGMTADEADYSNETYAKLANTAKEMGASTKFSASESAGALNYMALAGYDADKSCAALPTVLNLAASGGMELAAASDMVTDSMSALGIEATTENLTKFGDQLAKTSQKSNTSVAQLGEAVLTVGGTAKTLSGGTTELNTLLGIIADNGVKGAEGGTALRNIMLSLQAPTDIAAKKMKSLGLSVYDAEGKMRPMNDILTDLTASMDGVSDQKKQDILSTIFNKRDLKSVNALLSGVETASSKLQNKLAEAGFDTTSLVIPLDELASSFDKAQDKSEFIAKSIKEFGMTSEQAGILFDGLGAIADGNKSRFGELSGLIDNSSGAMKNMADTMNNNLLGRVTEFKSALEGLGNEVYEAFGRTNMKNAVKEASGWITELTDATKAGGIEGLVSQLGPTMSKALVAISGYIPRLVQTGVSIINSLITGIAQNKDQILQSIMIGLLSMLSGVAQFLPQLVNAGISLIASLLSGLNSQMPMILQMGLNTIQNLCAGLLANGPAILQSGLNLILQLLNGLIAAAPTILTTGIQLVILLAQGLIAAIPQLIQAIPQLVSAIITTLMSVDWLKLGLDIIKGIGNGLISGIKSLFNKGKDAGKEVGDGLTEGLNESTSGIVEAGEQASAAVTDGMQPVNLEDYGIQTGMGYANGIQAGSPAVWDASACLSGRAAAGLAVPQGAEQFGVLVAQDMALGMTSQAGVVATAADLLSEQATSSADTDIAITVSADSSGFDMFDASLQGTLTTTQESMARIPPLIETTFVEADQSMTQNLTSMSTAMKVYLDQMCVQASSFASAIKQVFARIQLQQTGTNIMAGLDRGMQSMRPQLLATAAGMAKDISDTINQSLDIHSPSRVTERSGEYAALGMAKGLKNMTGKVAGNARAVGKVTAENITPIRSRYSPGVSQMTNNQSSSSQVTNYSPVFQLTLNGASASDSNARKVKRWVKDAMNEAVQSMGRTSLTAREV